MNFEKELAYRYDLLIASDWRDRFDSLVNSNVKFPTEGRILDLNCGTGAHAIELAIQMRGTGDVIGVDPDPERIEIAKAKALAQRVEDVSFEEGDLFDLRFIDEDFNAVIGDATMLHTTQIEPLLKEMVRVAQYDAPVILKLTTNGSFDDFFSIYWEALMRAGIVEESWGDLDKLIHERLTVEAAKSLAEGMGLHQVICFTSKEEFEFEDAREFIESPIIKDIFLDDWLQIVAEPNRQPILDNLLSIIDEERHHNRFAISIKAAVIKGIK
jgi:ubiquinone/menaquinone biosynthesis C-methylase UbiE